MSEGPIRDCDLAELLDENGEVDVPTLIGYWLDTAIPEGDEMMTERPILVDNNDLSEKSDVDAEKADYAARVERWSKHPHGAIGHARKQKARNRQRNAAQKRSRKANR